MSHIVCACMPVVYQPSYFHCEMHVVFLSMIISSFLMGSVTTYTYSIKPHVDSGSGGNGGSFTSDGLSNLIK